MSGRRIPGHVAIIMDGNGRWAEMRGLPRVEGHKSGAERAKEIITAASESGIDTLTLYAFSSENWQRPGDEISMLMRILESYLKTRFDQLIKKGIVFKTIGEIQRLPKNIRLLIEDAKERSSSNRGMKLVLALSYGGRNEIIRAVRKIIENRIRSEDITESLFENNLDTAGLRPPDLIIRTSGEKRISNFLLWQAAYSELYFTDTLWPDFTKDEFFAALRDYQLRDRRFGTVLVRSSI